MITATINLPTLRCHEQYDESGHSEPYLWTAFFWADITTIPTALKVKVTVPLSSSSLRDNFQNAVSNGQEISIPPEVGRCQVRLDDGGMNLAMFGVLVALLEQDDTPDRAIRRGHQVFYQAVSAQLNQYIEEHGQTPPTAQQIADIAASIERTTKSAVKSQLDFWDLFYNQDDFLGFTYVLSVGPQLREPADTALTLPLIEKDVFQRLTNGQQIKVGHQKYEIINGRLTVEPFVPDPCGPEVVRLNNANRAVEQVQDRIRALQAQLSSASPAQKIEILREVGELRTTELPPAIEAVRVAQQQLSACRNRN
jgi:hypothetical protein